jgi:chemotaxis protein MotA
MPQFQQDSGRRPPGNPAQVRILLMLWHGQHTMKRIIETRRSTLLGLLGGVIVLAASALTSHQNILALINLPGIIMVIGGTLTATFVSRPVKDVLGAMKSVRGLMHDDDMEVEKDVSHLYKMARWYRLGNILAVEREIALVVNPLLRTGAQLVLDQEPIQDIVKTLQWRIAGARAREQGDASILRTMAGFAPAFGMLGTVFGLMQMLNTLGSAGLSAIGASMSFALITTLYGLVLANMVFKPLAMKMERRIQHHVTSMNFILEGVLLLHQRRHPMAIKEALSMYMTQLQTGQNPAPLARAA